MTGRGGRLYNVAAGTAILAGEPVSNKAVGDVALRRWYQFAVVSVSAGVEGLFVGIAATNSTNTTTAAGTVQITPTNSSIVYLGNPDIAASWDTQAEYDALVVNAFSLKILQLLLQLHRISVHTVLASDSANNGCTVVAMNIAEHPAKVAFVFRQVLQTCSNTRLKIENMFTEAQNKWIRKIDR